MAITIPEITSINIIDDNDNIMLTHSDGNSEKISGADLKADIVKNKIENNNGNAVSVNAVSTIIATSTTITGPGLGTGGNIKILFTSDIVGLNTSTPLVINYNGSNKNVNVNKDGTLVSFVASNIASGVYKYLQAYTTLEMVYDGTQFIVINNPIVLSNPLYTIHADGSVGGGMIGDIKPVPYVDVPYGWLECNGQAVSRTTYAALFNIFSTQKYDGTNTLLSRYGTGDGSTTFNLPDYREVALVGAGQNGTEGAALADHDVYTVGQFKDDQLQAHRHFIYVGGTHLDYTQTTAPEGWAMGGMKGGDANNFGATEIYNGRKGTTTRGKSKAVKFIIKVL